MKQLIILVCTVSTLMVAQDAAGQYKLTGVNVEYTFVARGETILTVTDAYGFGITQAVATIPGGAPFTTQAMQLTNAALAAVGINLNVTLNEDGSGGIAEGSYYPDVNTIVDENGNCVTLQQVLPVTDVFAYSSMGNGMAAIGMAHPGVNVLGIPGISNYAGQQMGLLGLTGSATFEDYPMIPSHPEICAPSAYCDHDGDNSTAPIVCDPTDCFPFTVGDYDGSCNEDDPYYGTAMCGIDIYPAVNAYGFPEYVPGGYPLTGVSGGFFLKRGLNTDDLSSVYPGNTEPDFILEWHGVDGASAGLGQGPYMDGFVEEDDEDGDGSWFDRQLGIPGITATYMNAALGYTQPIYGDMTGVFPPEYIDYVDAAASGYLMDASLAPWGNFLTAHAAIYAQCAPLLGPDMCASFGLLVDDSGYDVDPSCLSDYNPADLTTILDCAGRLTMNFDIPCVPIVEAREVVAEFIEVGGDDTCGSGDINADGNFNVLDVVALVNCVLSESCSDCAGDINADGNFNVLDVVALVNCVLAENCNGGGRIDEATSAEFNVTGNEVTMTADGYVGAVEMTLLHGNDFVLTLTDDALVAQHLTDGNTTRLMIVEPTGSSLFTTRGDFTIESVIAAANGESYLETTINNLQGESTEGMISNYSLSTAYPNPFNPTTSLTLAVPMAGHVSVQVYNIMGQVVATLASGYMDANTSIPLTWDASNVSSGMYFVKAEADGFVSTQKLLLMK